MTELGWKYLTREDKAQIVRGIRDGVAYGGPYHVEIHPADRCNIDCFFCSTAALRGTDELPVTRLEELIGELQALGTRAIRLSGGGEPLFHRRSKEVLRAIASSGIPIENLTTNAVLLSEEHASILVDCCDQVTVSLNTADEETYASMMQTPSRNFERVLKNVRGLIAERRRRGSATPRVNLQFLVWRDNYRSIPRMYELARELDVDTILFNGLSFLKPEQKMTPAETAEMMALYESVIRIDEFRRIASIESYEQDIRPMLTAISTRLAAGRQARGPLRRLAHLLTRSDLTLRQKLAHRRRLSALRRVEAATSGMDDSCVIGWHSMLIRTSGMVAPCCILQGAPLGNVFEQSVSDVWYGERYGRFRGELSRILRAPDRWEHDPAEDQTVVAMCGRKGSEVCPIKSFYYRPDVDFMRALSDATGNPSGASASQTSPPL